MQGWSVSNSILSPLNEFLAKPVIFMPDGTFIDFTSKVMLA